MLKKEFLEKVYTEINDNIKFSEAKNAALVTLNSALISAASTKAFDYKIAIQWRILIVFLIISLLIPLILALVSFKAKMHHNCFIKNDDEQKFMFFSYIKKNFYKSENSYIAEINKNFKDEFTENQLAKQIVDLSYVANKKFLLFNIALFIEILIFVLGAILTLSVIYCKLNNIDFTFFNITLPL